MTIGTVATRRLLAGLLSVALAALVIWPAATLADSHDPELLATLELRDGDIEYELELGTLHFFSEENVPFAVQVIDGCALNDHLWLFGAGLSGVPVVLEVMDLDTGKSVRTTLPPFEPGVPIATSFEPEALALCPDDVQVGGLPPLGGAATLTSADARGQDGSDTFRLLSDGRDNAYRRLARAGASYPIIQARSPVVAIDDSASFDQIYLFTEGRTPGEVAGVVFSGDDGMLPTRADLDKALKGITSGRVRRAFEAAQTGRVPEGLIEDLGLRKVQRVHHVGLDFETLGAMAYLAQAGWIKQDTSAPIEPPQPVEPRFTVELVRADGEREVVPLVGPLQGSGDEGRYWEYRSNDALARVVDACGLGGTFWTWAGVTTDEPVELVVTDTKSGTSASHLVWTDRRDVSRLADTTLAACP
jgi:hypothetical protein